MDNGSCYRSKAFAKACKKLGLKLRCVGLMRAPTTPPMNAPPNCPDGCTVTIGTALTAG